MIYMKKSPFFFKGTAIEIFENTFFKVTAEQTVDHKWQKLGNDFSAQSEATVPHEWRYKCIHTLKNNIKSHPKL